MAREEEKLKGLVNRPYGGGRPSDGSGGGKNGKKGKDSKGGQKGRSDEGGRGRGGDHKKEDQKNKWQKRERE